MTKEVHFPILDVDVEVMKHIEPARLIDNALAALRYKANALQDGNNPVEFDKTDRAHRDLVKVRNAWVLALGTIRLQLLGGDG